MKNESSQKPDILSLKYLLIIIVVLLLIGFGILYLYFDKKNYSSKPKESPKPVFKDEEAPVITASNITITEGDQVDLFSKATVTDNVDENVKLDISGDYDVNKPGKYKVTYIATDSSQNMSTQQITLTVKAKKQVNLPVSETKKVNFTTSKGFSGYTENGITYIDGVLVVNKTYSLPKNYGNGLTNKTQTAFNDMKAAALTDGINLWVCSGYRSYKTQKNLYNSYVNRDGKAKADTYSARAGYSEHQSGLAIDINVASSSFNDTNEAKWLNDNAYKFGFILRYPNGKTNETGYKFESWHYRYVGVDLASKLYNNGDWITLEDYFGITSQYSN